MSVASDNASVVRGHFFSSFFFMWKGAEQVSLVAMSDFYTAWNYRRTKKNHIHKYVSGRQLSFLYIYTIFTLTLTSISRGTIEKTYGSFQVSELDAFSRRGWSFSQRSRQNTTPFFYVPISAQKPFTFTIRDCPAPILRRVINEMNRRRNGRGPSRGCAKRFLLGSTLGRPWIIRNNYAIVQFLKTKSIASASFNVRCLTRPEISFRSKLCWVNHLGEKFPKVFNISSPRRRPVRSILLDLRRHDSRLYINMYNM